MLRGGLPKEFGNRLEEHFGIFFHHLNMCQQANQQKDRYPNKLSSKEKRDWIKQLRIGIKFKDKNLKQIFKHTKQPLQWYHTQTDLIQLDGPFKMWRAT